jgi:hypothetical protein
MVVLVEKFVNSYAMVPDAIGKTLEGPKWEDITMAKLKAFMALALYMELKKQPNYKTYWMHHTLFHCLMISNIFLCA